MNQQQLFSIELSYEKGKSQVVDAPGRTGDYVGSGVGTISGEEVKGSVEWELFEKTVGSGKAALYAFGTAALTIALVMILLVIAIDFAKTNVLRSMQTNTQTVERLGGAVLIFVGAWLMILAIWADIFIRLLYV